jgi:hypothetical protein
MWNMSINMQYQQLINLLILLLIGKYLAHIYLSWGAILVLLSFTVVVEHLFLYIKHNRNIYFSFSSLSTVIGIMLMMVSLQLWVYLLVIVMGLLQKHFLQIEGRHFFNPSNFALLMALLLFYDKAHIVLGQLGDDWWILCFVLVLAGTILWRVNRWMIPLCFCLAYLFFEYYLIIRHDPVMIMEHMTERFLSVSFVVFIVFMLTDPRTTTAKPIYQIEFAVCIALGAAVLDASQGFRVQHLFFSLAFCTPWVVTMSLWKNGCNQRHLFVMTTVIIVFVVSSITFIERKPPYYFLMD